VISSFTHQNGSPMGIRGCIILYTGGIFYLITVCFCKIYLLYSTLPIEQNKWVSKIEAKILNWVLFKRFKTRVLSKKKTKKTFVVLNKQAVHLVYKHLHQQWMFNSSEDNFTMTFVSLLEIKKFSSSCKRIRSGPECSMLSRTVLRLTTS
jgi:hypothetical protein